MDDHETRTCPPSPKTSDDPAEPPRLRALELGGFRIVPELLTIEGSAGSVTIEAKAMAVFELLASRVGIPVSKDEILAEVWAGRYVSDDVVWRAIGILRKSMGDSASEPRYIATVRGKGYRLLVAPRLMAPRPVPRVPGTWNGGIRKGSAEMATPTHGRMAFGVLLSLWIVIIVALCVRIQGSPFDSDPYPWVAAVVERPGWSMRPDQPSLESQKLQSPPPRSQRQWFMQLL